jgi:hypothetical protein
VDRGPEAFGLHHARLQTDAAARSNPRAAPGQLCERKLAWCTSFQHRFYQIRGEKCRTDELAHITFAFAQRGAIMRNDTSPLKSCSSH